MRTVRRIWVAAMIAVCALPAHADGSIETEVKATFLYKFAPFVQWPAAAFNSAAAPFNICVVGFDPFGSLLDQAVARQTIGDHPIALRRLAVAGPGCHIAYVGGAATFVSETVGQLRRTPVLTVTDMGPTSGIHGIINFVVEANHVRFDIDDAAAAENGLVISSKLLRLARAIRAR